MSPIHHSPSAIVNWQFNPVFYPSHIERAKWSVFFVRECVSLWSFALHSYVCVGVGVLVSVYDLWVCVYVWIRVCVHVWNHNFYIQSVLKFEFYTKEHLLLFYQARVRASSSFSLPLFFSCLLLWLDSASQSTQWVSDSFTRGTWRILLGFKFPPVPCFSQIDFFSLSTQRLTSSSNQHPKAKSQHPTSKSQ